jgi:spermidine synthase
VKKWTTVDTAPTPDGRTISLMEHDGSYSIRVEGAELMSTRQHASEEKIAELACAHLKNKRGARVLVGGLGFGFTLKAALAVVAPDARVIVAEILSAVIAWNRNPSFHLAGESMDDPRVTILQQDVREAILHNQGGFDSIILDVDNGPAALTADGNAGLYGHAGLQLAKNALRPGGCVGFWAAAPDVAFEKQMRHAGFTVELVRCRSRPNSGSWHTLFMGRVLKHGSG